MTDRTTPTEPRSTALPTDPFELALNSVLGHPDGAHTGAAVVQAVDFYGKATQYIMQTVKWPEGTSVFITQVNSEGSARFVLPPKVMALLFRQQDAVTTIARRRQGVRLAETAKANGQLRSGGFTPEMRRKAAATRRAKAAKRAAWKAARA
jgi:LmbE family N-acetylglucosaminyl deacetylase